MAKEILLTQAGYDDLVKELDYLKTEKRAEIAEKIKVARGFGDLSENSEYDEAKNEQGLVEQQINEMEYTLKHAKIVNKEEKEEAERIRKQEAWAEAEKKKEEEQAEKLRLAREALKEQNK